MQITLSDIRELVNEVVLNRTKKRQKGLDDRHKKIGDAIYKHVLGPYRRQLAALPDWAVVEKSEIAFHYVGGRGFLQLPMTKSRLQPRSMAYPDFQRDHEVVLWYEALKNERDDLDKQQKEAREHLLAFARQYRSLPRLLKAWPDLKKEAPQAYATVEAKQRQLPTVRIEGVQALLDNLSKAA